MKQVVACVGMYRSGSTWIYNVVNSIIKHHCETDQFYSDDADKFIEKVDLDKSYIIKSHLASEKFLKLLNLLDAKFIVSIRDPIYCVNSMMRQFETDFNQSLNAILGSINTVERITETYNCLLLKYEDGFENNSNFVDVLTNFLKQELRDDQKSLIVNNHTKENIKSYISDLIESKYYDGKDPLNQYHEKTHWHPNHIGPNIKGKDYLILRDSEIYTIRDATKHFRAKYEYSELMNDPPICDDSIVKFAENDTGLKYLVSGFSIPEEWGIWSLGCRSKIQVPIKSDVRSFSLIFSFVLCDVFKYLDDIQISISANGKICFFEIGYARIQELQKIIINDLENIESNLVLEIEIKNIKTLKELSISNEDREIGIAPRYISIFNIK